MADAPKPSGGGSWTAIEVIIVLILILAVLARVFGKPLTIFDGAGTSDTTTVQPQVAACTVAVTAPKPLGPVADYAVISGYTKHCADTTTGALPPITAVVVDGAGMPLSPVTTLSTSYSDIENKVPFAATIALTAKSSTKTGYVIVSANGFTDSGSTSRVPVTFK